MTYIIEPEVSGQLGETTVIDTTSHPPIVKYLHFVFHGWLGDDLLECFPIFLITERLKLKLHESGLTGFQVKDCEIEASDEFILLQPSIELPNFYWLEVTGNSSDDFSILNN